MHSQYLHYIGGFGAHSAKLCERKEQIIFAGARKYCPDYEIVLHCPSTAYRNVPSYITRNEICEETMSYWPNFKLIRAEHKADKARLLALQEHGGLSSDLGDQFFINSPDFSPLHGQDKLWLARWTIGKSHLLCGAMFAGKANCSAINQWIAEYNRAESLGGWQDLSCFLPSKLAKQYPELFELDIHDSPYGKSPFYEHGSIRRKDLDCDEPWPKVSGKGIMVHCSFRGQKEPIGQKYDRLLDWLEKEHC